MDFLDIKNDEETYLMHTYARYTIAVESGKGSTLKDINGKDYIDFSSGIGVNSLGYSDDEWIKAISTQAEKLSHISNLYYTLPQIELAKKLIDISNMSKVFLSNSGAEANEGAIKLARKYSFDKYGKNRATIITLKNSFHGRTITTLKATGQDKFHNYFFPFTDGFKYVEANDIDDLINKIDDSVCGIMMESVQGEGGVLPLDYEFVKKTCDIAKSKDILVIFDEVQTGIGRTGKFFGYQHYDVEPDIITVAKGLGGGLPIGGFICNEKLENVLSYGHHGTTFGGNPICCAGACVVLDKISQSEFLEQVNSKSEYIISRINKIQSNVINSVRGKGLMLGIELVGVEPKEIVEACLEKGLILLTAGINVIRMLPPLVITNDEIDKGIDILEEILEKYNN